MAGCCFFLKAVCCVMWENYPGGSDGKASACNAGDPGLIPGSGRSPWGRKWQPTPVLLPGQSHGQRSLLSYSPWGLKELGTTECLSTQHIDIDIFQTEKMKVPLFFS